MAKKKNEYSPLNQGPAPHHLEAEQAVLGTFFLNPGAVVDVQNVVSVEDFYDPRHRDIFKAVIHLVEGEERVDPMTVGNELNRQGVLDRVGGVAYIAALEDAVFSPGNVLHHAKIIHEKALLRRLIALSREVSEKALSESEDAQSLLEYSEDKIFQILSSRSVQDFVSLEDEHIQVFQNLLRRAENRQEVTGIPTGIARLDKMTGGLHPSDLVILAARPSVGKTSFALNLAVNAARNRRQMPDGAVRHPAVGIFSLEMSREQVIHRMVCTEAGIPMDLIRKNMLSEKQLSQFQQELEQMRELPLFINDTPGLDPTEMRLQALRLKARNPDLSMIIVDYLQLMAIKHNRPESRQQEVSQISRMLKALARDLNVPVVALSQLSRSVESRKGNDSRPRLADLRESGAIEQDADTVMFLHRLSRSTEDKNRPPDAPRVSTVDLIIAKQRNGPIGDCPLVFLEDFTRFQQRIEEE